jgi:hypothetical protein
METDLSTALGKALFTVHFSKKIFKTWSTNNDARIKILIDILAVLVRTVWDFEYLYSNIVIYRSSFEKFFTKITSEGELDKVQ